MVLVQFHWYQPPKIKYLQHRINLFHICLTCRKICMSKVSLILICLLFPAGPIHVQPNGVSRATGCPGAPQISQNE